MNVPRLRVVARHRRGAIVGITVGSVAVAEIGGFSIFWFAIKKKKFADFIAAIKGIFKKK